MFSIWEQRSFGGVADVAVVGSGITGLFAAIHAKRMRPRSKVVVLEQGMHPSGASVKNAGVACFGSPSEILADIASEGRDAALTRVQERWLGLQELRSELGDERIGFEPSGGHELFMDADPLYTRTAEGLDGLNGDLRALFGRNVFEWCDDRKGDLGLHVDHLVHTPFEGPLDSGRLMQTLLALTASVGVEVRDQHRVLEINDSGSDVVLTCANKTEVRAAKVIIATNGYAAELVPGIDVKPARGQVLVTSVIPGLTLSGTFHMNEGFYYFRDLQGRVLLGGGRHLDKAGETTTADGTTPLIQNALEALLREVILPGKPFTVEHRWSGVMGFRSAGKEALVAHHSPNVVTAVGLSGMGVAIGIRVARKAAVLALG